MNEAVSIIKAIEDRNLFRPLFRDLKTWAAWIVFLKALFALPMQPDELTLYRSCTGREQPPQKPFKEAWIPTGRRSGKSFIAALLAVFLACFRDYRPYLSPGERAYVLVLAADRGQAAVILRYVKGFLAAIPMLSAMVEAERVESIDLKNSVTIAISTCSYKSVRGFTVAAVIADEIAFWKADDGRNPATEVLRALRPAMGTIPGALLMAISSPYSRSGVLYETFNAHYGRDDTDILCWQAPTRVMNPTISQETIDRDMALDPEAARAEWLAEWRSDLEAYLPVEAIQGVTVQDRLELPPLPGVRYTAFADPSGGRKDPAALAVAHIEKETIILDVARRYKAPHDPAIVVGEMASICRDYRITRVKGDRYAGAWPEQEFLKHGITYEAAGQDKSAMFLDFLPLILSSRVELLDNPVLFAELRALERRTRKGGRDLVDHPPKGHDDLANAVAGACVELGVLRRQDGILEFMRQEVERLRAVSNA
jgi:hypothetical protein